MWALRACFWYFFFNHKINLIKLGNPCRSLWQFISPKRGKPKIANCTLCTNTSVDEHIWELGQMELWKVFMWKNTYKYYCIKVHKIQNHPHYNSDFFIKIKQQNSMFILHWNISGWKKSHAQSSHVAGSSDLYFDTLPTPHPRYNSRYIHIHTPTSWPPQDVCLVKHFVQRWRWCKSLTLVFFYSISRCL